MLSKYGKKELVEEKMIPFSQYFENTCCTPLLESHLQLIFKRKNVFVGSKCLNFAIKFVSFCTKVESSMEKLKPFIENLLYETIIPIMLITHKDALLYKEDPIEYIRKQMDLNDTFFTARNSVLDLLIYLCSYKSSKKNPRPDYIHAFLKFCVDNLVQYQGQPNPDFRIKEAILHAIGHLSSKIKQYPELKSQMEPMLISHVLPEFKNESLIPTGGSGFMKMRCLWIYGELGSFKFTDMDHIRQSIDCIYQCLAYHSDLPVRVMAATSIHKLLNNKTAFEFLKPALSDILQVYLKLMTEIESEELVYALEEIVTHFKEDISPYAVELTSQLVTSYQRLIQVNVEDDDGESALAAVGCVTAIRRILDSVQENKGLLAQLEERIFPILMHGLTQDGMDAIEDALDCVVLLLYYGGQEKIS